MMTTGNAAPTGGSLKRSNAPVFWLLFGAGGMLSALIGTMLVFITGLAVPLGLGLPNDTMSYPRLLALAHSLIGKGFIFCVIALFLWHAGHRIFHSLHDLGLHPGVMSRALCYGVPLLASLASLVWLLTL